MEYFISEIVQLFTVSFTSTGYFINQIENPGSNIVFALDSVK